MYRCLQNHGFPARNPTVTEVAGPPLGLPEPGVLDPPRFLLLTIASAAWQAWK